MSLRGLPNNYVSAVLFPSWESSKHIMVSIFLLRIGHVNHSPFSPALSDRGFSGCSPPSGHSLPPNLTRSFSLIGLALFCFPPPSLSPFPRVHDAFILNTQGMSGRPGTDYFNKLVLLCKLRQACNHPLLLQASSFSSRRGDQQVPSPELAAAARLAPEVWPLPSSSLLFHFVSSWSSNSSLLVHFLYSLSFKSS